MVALSPRFTLLAALCALTFVAPLITNAAAVEGRYSDKSVNSGTRISSGRERQPVIPPPRRSDKRSRKGSSLERDRKLKGKGKEQKRRTEWSRVAPLADRSQATFASTRGLQERRDDDCPRKVIVNGGQDHVRMKCRRDGDHHDDEKVITHNGDRDRLRTRGDTFQPRSPRHTRPLFQRRNETMTSSTNPKGVPGVVEVTGTDGANGQPTVYGEFVTKQSGSAYDIEVSSTNHTTFYMVGSNSTAADSSSSSEKPVTLQALLPDHADSYCCSYDPNPSGPQPMKMEVCRGEASSDSSLSQIFLFDAVLGVLKPVWRGANNGSSVASSGSSQTSSQTAGDQTQNKGDQNVKLIWKPVAQGSGAKLEPPSGGPTTETKTVTVTVTVNGASSSAMREASTTLAQSISTEPTPLSASPTMTDGSPSAQVAAPTSTAQSAGLRPTGGDGLKVEVLPTQAPSASSQAMNTTAEASSTTTSVASGVPAREGQILEAVVAPEDDDSDM